MRMKLRTVGIAALLLLALFGAGLALFVYAGIYNIAATEQHTGPMYRLLDYAMRRSVAARATAIEVPNLKDDRRIRSGARHYRAQCQQCHGAPGVAPDAAAFGLTPAPANLVSAGREWNAADIFWVIKHGIKMSGMPAWEYRMRDEEIWDVVAFIGRMPALSPVEYAALERDLAGQVPGTATTSGDLVRGTELAAPKKGPAAESVLGNAEAGRRAAGQYLCATCHQIPGMPAAHRQVGPPLNGIAHRRYLGGVLINTPENMVRWLQNPQQIDPLSAMPDLRVTEKDARDIAAFLYTLEDLE